MPSVADTGERLPLIIDGICDIDHCIHKSRRLAVSQREDSITTGAIQTWRSDYIPQPLRGTGSAKFVAELDATFHRNTGIEKIQHGSVPPCLIDGGPHW